LKKDPIGINRPQKITVPCNGCTACCRNNLVLLMPGEGDIPEAYERQRIEAGVEALAHQPNGDCWYLGQNGCTIHNRKPVRCRAFDCRRFILSTPRELIPDDIYQAGKARAHTLTAIDNVRPRLMEPVALRARAALEGK
jgi:hypothetical protein